MSKSLKFFLVNFGNEDKLDDIIKEDWATEPNTNIRIISSSPPARHLLTRLFLRCGPLVIEITNLILDIAFRLPL